MTTEKVLEELVDAYQDWDIARCEAHDDEQAAHDHGDRPWAAGDSPVARSNASAANLLQHIAAELGWEVVQ